MAETGARLVHGSVSTTADTVELTKPCREVWVTNEDTTNTIYVTHKTGTLTLNPATTATSTVDDMVIVPPKQRRLIFRSTRLQLVNLNLLATTGSTEYSVEGTTFLTT